MNSNPEAIFDILSGYPIWLSWFARQGISKYILIYIYILKYSIIQYTLFWYTLRSALEKKSEFCFKDSQHQQKKCIADFSESMLKRKIWKNVLLISMAFMVLFTSFQSMASLQSSINKARKMSIFVGKCNTFASICKIYKKGILKSFNLGPRSGCLFIVHHIWVIDYFLSIYSKSDYQIFRIQMDYGWMHALLFIIYNCTILSKIWNIITRSYYSWICCCTSVDF